MLLEPPIDVLIEKVGNPYKLAVIIGKRSKILQQKSVEEFQPLASPKVTKAVYEIYNGKIVAE